MTHMEYKDGYITWTPQKLLRLIKARKAAIKDGQEWIMIEGQALLTGYAAHLEAYLRGRFGEPMV